LKPWFRSTRNIKIKVIRNGKRKVFINTELGISLSEMRLSLFMSIWLFGGLFSGF
jgi:hypothetical protein